MEDPYQNVNSPKNKRLIYITLFMTVVIMFLATLTFIISNVNRNADPNNTTAGNNSGSDPTGSVRPGNLDVSTSQKPPQVKFSKWVEPTNQPTALNSPTTYVFKQNYTQKEVADLAFKLNANKVIKQDADVVLAYTLSPNSTSALHFNTKSGAFSYLNSRGVPLSTGNDSMETKINQFLQSIDIYDPTLILTANYKRRDNPGVTFFEIHRDWSKVGMPILNFNGLFNVPENQSLRSISLQGNNTSLPLNSNIYAASDRKNGVERPSDFNTITVIVSDNPSAVVGVVSKMRKLQQNAQKSAAIITYQEALQKLRSNQYEMIFTAPSGDGSVAWSKIYPQNQAVSDQAVVSEAVYAYLEKPPLQAQNSLKPYLLFRGTSVLETGYSVNFIAAVDVTLPTTSATNRGVLGTSTYLAQQSEGDLDVIPSPFASPTGVVGSFACPINVNELSPTFEFQGVRFGLGQHYTYHGPTKGFEVDPTRMSWYYIFPDSYLDIPSPDKEAKLRADWELILANLMTVEATGVATDSRASFYAEKSGFLYPRTWELILDSFNGTGRGDCPIVFSGLSPVIFAYGPEGKTVAMKSGGTLTYSDPATEDSMWNVTFGSNDTLSINELSRQYIYYEYAPVVFNRPQLGWNVSRNNLPQFVNIVSEKLQLHPLETAKLQTEIANAAKDVTGNSLFIGIINQQELNTKLPLFINPVPDTVERYHFYIGKTSGKVQAPEVSTVERSEFMILELGAVPGK